MQQYEIIGGGAAAAIIVGSLVLVLARHGRQRRPNGSNSKLASSLHDEQAKNSIILSSIEDGVVLLDDEGIIRLFNPSASTVTGWKKEDAEGLDWKSVFEFVNNKGEPTPENESPFSRAKASGQPLRDNDANLKVKSGNTVAASISVSPILDNNKQVTGLVGVFRDVSTERQEQAQRAEFISTASHEMRTPVAAIEGYLSLALNDKVATIDDRAKDYLQKAHAATKHLGELFQDLLTSAKAEDGRLTNHPEVVELGAFMEQLASDLHFTAQKKGLSLEFIIGNSNVIDATAVSQKVVRPLYYVRVDPDRLREVITNLFDNACKYTDEGKVTLGLTGNDQVVQVYIKDTGHGIPAEDIPHLFQKFYRVDNTATRTVGGTGLGLFIVRKIIELYHGRVWVESTINKGSTFYINLPRLSTQTAQQLLTEQTKGGGLSTITPDTPAAPASSGISTPITPTV